jgi:hypothetical protein
MDPSSLSHQISVFSFPSSSLSFPQATILTPVCTRHRTNHHNTPIWSVFLGRVRIAPSRRRLHHSRGRIFESVEWGKRVRFKTLVEVGRRRFIDEWGTEESRVANPDVKAEFRRTIFSKQEKLRAGGKGMGSELLPAPGIKDIIDKSQRFVLLRDLERVPDHAGVGVIGRDESCKRGIVVAWESITR